MNLEEDEIILDTVNFVINTCYNEEKDEHDLILLTNIFLHGLDHLKTEVDYEDWLTIKEMLKQILDN